MTTRQFGVLPSPPDARDFPVRAFLPAKAAAFPDQYDLPLTLPVYDQADTAMCVDFTLRSLKELQEWRERGVHEPMANGYLYGRREAGHYRGEGMIPREALDTLLKRGIPPASTFNAVGTFTECWDAVRAAGEQADTAAKPQQTRSYARCASLADVQGALYHLGSPVMITIIATRRFANLPDTRGLVEVETVEQLNDPQNFLGGHAMLVIGWRTVADRIWYRVRNSWGSDWGAVGDCYIRVDDPRIQELWTVTDAVPRGRRLRMTIGSPEMQLVSVHEDGTEQVQTLAMDVAPFLKDGRAFVPVRWVSNALARLLGVPVAVNAITDAAGNVLDVEVVLLERGEAP